ncbi:hypothetical protein ACHAWC_011745 [Mediolabrus comicus]
MWRYRGYSQSQTTKGSSAADNPTASKPTQQLQQDDGSKKHDDDEVEAQLNNLTVEELKAKLRERCLKVSGKKQELIDRLLGREISTKKKVAWQKSKAKCLLQQSLLDQKSHIHGKSVEDIHASHEWFQEYPLDKFRKYYEALKTSSGRHQTIVEEDNRIIRSEIQNFPRKDKTCRGRYWWDTHEAKIKLKEDVAQGKHLTTKPKQLWLSRKIYQDFALSVFRGHIYQEKRRQKELPLRVARRNKVAAKKYKKEVDESSWHGRTITTIGFLKYKAPSFSGSGDNSLSWSPGSTQTFLLIISYLIASIIFSSSLPCCLRLKSGAQACCITMMTFNWLKLYDTEHVLSGRWKRGEEYIRKKTKKISELIQSMMKDVVVFDVNMFHDDEVHWLSVDTVDYITEEFRQTPGTKWWDHKANCAGLKYQYLLAIRHNTCVSVQGPFPAAERHDKTLFCGGTNKEPKETWDKQAVYHQIPEGKKVVGDSAYEGVPEKCTVKRVGQDKAVRDLIDLALCRQETFHGRLSTFAILRHRFRHGKSTENKMAMHKTGHDAVVVITMYDLKHHPLFEVTTSPNSA